MHRDAENSGETVTLMHHTSLRSGRSAPVRLRARNPFPGRLRRPRNRKVQNRAGAHLAMYLCTSKSAECGSGELLDASEVMPENSLSGERLETRRRLPTRMLRKRCKRIGRGQFRAFNQRGSPSSDRSGQGLCTCCGKHRTWL